MTDPLLALGDALRVVRRAWADEGCELPSVEALGGPRLVAVNDALGRVQRHLDAVRAAVAAQIARESRRELGGDSLAKQHGFRNAAALIAATTGTSTGDAARLVAVGQATAPRATLTGEPMPAIHPHVADALGAGRIGVLAASAIITMLTRVALRADKASLDAAEMTLAGQAPGLTLDQLVRVIARAEAHLDADGLEPKEAGRRGQRSLSMFERDGMLHLRGQFDIETGAPIKASIEGIVTAEFRRNEPAILDEDTRTVPQRQADALALLATHALGCDRPGLPLEGATVIVRMTLDNLQSGQGSATIDGIAQPISVSTARRMAATGGVIPCVLGGDSEVLDWGREKRLFTRAQKIALVERDGGCAMCALEPGKTKAHHLRWWTRDAGPTDLANGVLLCESCHHRIHDNGWDIRITGAGTHAKVWFIPPPHVDPDRTPRLGGRARYDYAA